jgi:hypothetical protein
MTTIYKLRLLGCYLGMVFLLAVTANGDNRFRTWIDSTGEFEIEAQFQRIKGNKVLLAKKIGGGELELDLKKLSKRDQEYVRLTVSGAEPNADFDAVAKAKPFIINFAPGKAAYKQTVKYPWKVDIKKTIVEFTISGNGNRPFPISTKQKQPVELAKSIKYEIRLAPKSAVDLAVDVEARISYDKEKSEFIVYVKPSMDVIRGVGGATKIALSVNNLNERVVLINKTNARFKNEIAAAPAQHARNLANWNTTNQLKIAALGVNRMTDAGILQTQMNNIQRANDILASQTKGKQIRVVNSRFILEYIDAIIVPLQGLQTITVEYKIFSKIGQNSVLILDGTTGKQ